MPNLLLFEWGICSHIETISFLQNNSLLTHWGRMTSHVNKTCLNWFKQCLLACLVLSNCFKQCWWNFIEIQIRNTNKTIFIQEKTRKMSSTNRISKLSRPQCVNLHALLNGAKLSARSVKWLSVNRRHTIYCMGHCRFKDHQSWSPCQTIQ